MINQELIKFEDFVNLYDNKVDKITFKKAHTHRVVAFCKQLADYLKLDEKDTRIAMLLGLYHDLGRFEQIRVYNTFDDFKSEDHAILSNKMLDKYNFLEEEVDANVIKTAIYNHNKFAIEDNLDARTLMFCKLIRDADKLDIITMFSKKELKVTATKFTISDIVYETLMNEQLIRHEDTEHKLDYYMLEVGLVFDLYFNYSIKYSKDHHIFIDLIDIIASNNPQESDRLIKVKNKLIEYTDQRLLNEKD